MITSLLVSLSTLLLGSVGGSTQQKIPTNQKVAINADLDIMRITDNCYLYTEWADMGSWGRVGCNGMIVVSDGEALLVDSPVSDAQTSNLAKWLLDNAGATIRFFIPGHWHSDCVGGLSWLNSNKVATYANQMTNDILKSHNRERAQFSFTDSLTITVGRLQCTAYYLGGGHSTDNVVVWFGDQSVLFGGCMVKDGASIGIGNTSDAAPMAEWLTTIERIEHKFKNARHIIPGHGNYGGLELLQHTKSIVGKEIKTNN